MAQVTLTILSSMRKTLVELQEELKTKQSQQQTYVVYGSIPVENGKRLWYAYKYNRQNQLVKAARQCWSKQSAITRLRFKPLKTKVDAEVKLIKIRIAAIKDTLEKAA